MRYTFTTTIVVTCDDLDQINSMRQFVIDEPPPVDDTYTVSTTVSEVSDEDGPQHEHLKGTENE